jgi:hypothetical protein
MHPEKHDMRSRNRLDSEISFLLLISHCFPEFLQSNASQRLLTTVGQGFLLALPRAGNCCQQSIGSLAAWLMGKRSVSELAFLSLVAQRSRWRGNVGLDD